MSRVIWAILKFVEGDLFPPLGLLRLVVTSASGGLLLLIPACDSGLELTMLSIVKGEVRFLLVGGVALRVGVRRTELACSAEDNTPPGNEFTKTFTTEGVLGDLATVLLGVVGEVLTGLLSSTLEVSGVEETEACEEGVP